MDDEKENTVIANLDRIARSNHRIGLELVEMNCAVKTCLFDIRAMIYNYTLAIGAMLSVIIIVLIAGFTYTIARQNDLIETADRAIIEIRQVAIDIREGKKGQADGR